MAESSKFWDGTTVGDATVSPYDANSEFAEVLKALAFTNALTNQGGVFRSYLNELEPTIVGAAIVVDTGGTLVDGTFYKNDAAVTLSISTPGGATRIDRVVLRKDWTAQTIRLALLTGAEGGAEPALTQTPGVTWEIPIVKVSTTTGGVITITDEREFIAGTAGLVGPTHTQALRYTPLLPIENINYPTVHPTALSPTMDLPSGVPPGAVAVALFVEVTTVAGTGQFIVGDAVSPNPAMRIHIGGQYNTGSAIGSGVVSINAGTPATISYSSPIDVDADVTLTVTGYWEPFA